MSTHMPPCSVYGHVVLSVDVSVYVPRGAYLCFSLFICMSASLPLCIGAYMHSTSAVAPACVNRPVPVCDLSLYVCLTVSLYMCISAAVAVYVYVDVNALVYATVCVYLCIAVSIDRGLSV